MPKLQWSTELSVGVATFDFEHKRLVSLLNELYDAIGQGQAREALGKILKNLINYTVTHFSNEERLMKEYCYPKYAEHKEEHESFVAQCLEMQKKYEEGDAALSHQVLHFLYSWISNHILKTDKEYGRYFTSRGVK